MKSPAHTVTKVIALGKIAAPYRPLRRDLPQVRASTVKQYIDDDQGLSLQQFECAAKHGHRWSFTGTAYGGDDGSYSGEGRCYCSRCGAGGDA